MIKYKIIMIQDEYIIPTESITGRIENDLLILESSLISKNYKCSMRIDIDLNVRYNAFYIDSDEYEDRISIIQNLVKNLDDIVVIHNMKIDEIEELIDNDDSRNVYLFIDILGIDTMNYLDLERLEYNDILLYKWEILN